MNSVKVGVVGLGNMGSAHVNSIFAGKIEGMELGATCDIAPNKQEWSKEHFPDIPCFADYKDMIQNAGLDAVVIATPHYLHPVIAVYAFEHGLHVLTEKPAGVYTKQVEEMNEAAKRSGKVFCIMYNQRTNPLFAKARELVQNGTLGELKRSVWIITNWYRTQAYYDSGSWRATWAGEGGGVLTNQCPHNLDLWQWICGMPSKVVGFASYGKYHDIEVEDDVTAYVEYANGATGVFITTTGEFPGTNRLEISGDRGKMIVEDGKIKLWELEIPEREFCFSTNQGFSSPPCHYREITDENPGTAHNGILQNFTNAILHSETLLAPGEEGINGLTISNAVYLSSWLDAPVTLPIDKELYFEKLKEKIATSRAKEPMVSEISDLQGTYQTRWDVKF